MTKKTQGDLEGDILKATGGIATSERLIKASKPEYFEIPHQMKMGISKALERGGITKWKTKEQSKYYTFWKMVRQESLKERKFFTGVAGGEKEMEAIEATTPNMKDSYSSFVATLENRKVLDQALRKRAMTWLDKGVNLKGLTPDQRAKLLEQDPLDNYGWYGVEKRERPKESTEEYGAIDRDVSEGKFEHNQIYEDGSGKQMRFLGYDKKGNPLWSEP